MENGKVIIGCRLDSKQLEKDLKNSEKELQKYEKEAEKLTEAKAKIDIDLQEYEKQKQLIQASTDETLKFAQTEEQVKTVLDLEKMELEELNQKYSTQFQKQSEINKKIEDNVKKQSILNDKIQETSKKLNQVKGFEQIKNEINEVNKGFVKTIKKVAKWGLALFGVRSAYNAIRGAMSTLSQYDTQMADNIEYIRYSLASSLQPVIQTILNLVIKLLQYINYIAKAWTGKNLFKTADAFKNAQKGAKGLNKELQKTTASFDEMNILQDTKSGGGGADISAPNIDLTGMQGEVPQWLKWIVDNKNLILSVFTGVNAGLLAWKLGLKGIQSLGIGLAIAGVIYGIQSIIKYLQDPSFENFGKIITGIGIAVAGVAIIFGAWPVAVGGAIAAIVGLIISNWEKIKEFMLNICKWLEDNFVLVGKTISDVIKTSLNLFEGLFKGVKQILDGIIKIFKGDFKNGISLAMRGIGNIIISVLNTVINGFNAFILPIRSLIVAAGKITGKKWTMNTIKIPRIPRLAKGGIINQPGRGIPVGSAIGGERGQEGVIPLTDSQQMQLLGEAIGRYVTINANITNTMNGRVISRELQKVNNTNDFAFNR